MTTEPTVEYINLEPNWEVVTEHFARIFAEQGFTKFAYGPMAHLLEAARYLAITDPEALVRVIDRLNKLDR